MATASNWEREKFSCNSEKFPEIRSSSREGSEGKATCLPALWALPATLPAWPRCTPGAKVSLALVGSGDMIQGFLPRSLIEEIIMAEKVSAACVLLLLISYVDSHSSSLKPTWPTYKVPVVLPQLTTGLEKPHFDAEPRLDVPGSCGPECHKHYPLPTLDELKDNMAYETLYSNGSRTLTEVGIYVFASGADTERSHGKSRHKRQIYGYDSRFSIYGKDFLLNYPFSTSVKLSTGCTGTLVAEKHVLTAAHCIHDGKNYVKGAQKLRVGFLKPKFKDGGKGINQTKSEKMKFQWIRVKRTHVPKGWIKGNTNDIGMDYDYALLELKKPHKRKFMMIGVSPNGRQLPGGKIHFSGFDNDRSGNLVYRFCDVKEETYDLLYQQCDAQPGASGSGVYVRMWKRDKQKWERKIIGIFSGHQWVDKNGDKQDFNVAVRITPLKYAQICFWIKGNYIDCRDG